MNEICHLPNNGVGLEHSCCGNHHEYGEFGSD